MVDAVAFLFSEAARLRAAEADVRDTLAALQFRPTALDAITQLYGSGAKLHLAHACLPCASQRAQLPRRFARCSRTRRFASATTRTWSGAWTWSLPVAPCTGRPTPFGS